MGARASVNPAFLVIAGMLQATFGERSKYRTVR